MMFFRKRTKEGKQAHDSENAIREGEISSYEEVQLSRQSENSSQEQESLIVKREIRLDLIFKIILSNWKKYIIPFALTAILSVLYIIQVPRYYKASVMLAPESSNTNAMGSLGGLAAMAGVNLNSNASQDAIIPTFYPDLMKSTDFIVPLLNVRVETLKGEYKGSLGTYLTKHKKSSALSMFMRKVVNAIAPNKPAEISVNKNGSYAINPFKMTKDEDALCSSLSGMINCTVDKKTDVISIEVTAQDALVAAQLADTLLSKLQGFITEYRTKKAKNDLTYYAGLCAKAKSDYEIKQHEYAIYADAYQDVTLQTFKVKEERLENEMQIAYNNYNQLKQQVQLAEAKVLERTPAFTTILNASVPVKPAGPKRVIFCCGMMILCFIVVTVWIIVRDPQLKF